MFKYFVLVILSILVQNCATTKIVSQVNPEKMNRSFKKVLILGNFQDLDMRQTLENDLRNKLARYSKCEFVKSLDLMFPGQEYSSKDIAKILNDNKIEAILIVQSTSSDILPSGGAFFYTFAIDPSTTLTVGNTSATKQLASFEIKLIDVSDQKVVWYATAKSQGAKMKDLINSVSSEIVYKLGSDRILQMLRR